MSTAGIALVLAPAIGPTLGGLLIDSLGRRWLFLVNLPVGAAALLLASRVLPKNDADRTARLDVVGLALPTSGLPLLSFGLTRVGGAGAAGVRGAVLAGAGALLLIAYLVEARLRTSGTARPTLLHLGLLRRPTCTTALVTAFLTGLSLFGGLVLPPLCYERLRGQTVIATGLLLPAYGAGAAVAMRVGGRLTDRIGAGAACVIGLIVTIGSTLPFVLLPADTDLVTVEALQAVRGTGVGIAGLPGPDGRRPGRQGPSR